MKMNYWIVSLTVGIIVLSSVVFFMAKEELAKDKELSYESNVVEKQGLRIKKIEKQDTYSYVIDDEERDLIYTWSFPKSIDDDLNIDTDLRIRIDELNGDAKIIDERVQENKMIVSFDYHGVLPEEATVKVNVGNKFKDGEDLYLYYYNPDNEEIEYIAHKLKVRDGHVEFQIEHCSDYFLTATVVQDAVNNPKSMNYVIIGLIVVAFILVAVTLGQSKK